MMEVTKEMILRAAHDMITLNYDWINENKANACQYILGIHDLAEALIENIEKKEN